MSDLREELLKANPEKQIEIGALVESGYGTHKYHCTWSGDWEAEELINFCDNSEGNYGGRIENIRRLEDGRFTGTVCVYYD